MKEMKYPRLSVNTKAYMYGNKLVEFAKGLDKLVEKYGIDIQMSTSFVDAARVAEATEHVIVTVQGMDPDEPGNSMGLVLPEALVEAGVEEVALNHVTYPMTLTELVKAVKRAREVGLVSCVYADSFEEVAMVAHLHPDVIICEQGKLIGTGVKSSKEYMKTTEEIIKEISPETIIIQGAGTKCPQDCYDAIMRGSQAAGGSSAIMCAEDPLATAEEMIKEMLRGLEDYKKLQEGKQ